MRFEIRVIGSHPDTDHDHHAAEIQGLTDKLSRETFPAAVCAHMVIRSEVNYNSPVMTGPAREAQAKTILLVEDEILIALAEKKLLERAGYEVLSATSGEKAIETVRNSNHIDLILMDIDLGSGMRGTEAASIILGERTIPLAFLSSHTEPEVVDSTEGITSYGYILKTSGDTVLLASIRMAFRLAEANRSISSQAMQMAAAYERLHDSDEKLLWWPTLMHYVVEHDLTAIAIFDSDLNFMMVSRRFLEDYRVSVDTVIGRNHYEVFPDIPQKWRDVHQRALRGEVIRSEKDTYPRSDGSTDYTRWECRPWFQADGSIGGIILYTEVLTELEKRFGRSE